MSASICVLVWGYILSLTFLPALEVVLFLSLNAKVDCRRSKPSLRGAGIALLAAVPKMELLPAGASDGVAVMVAGEGRWCLEAAMSDHTLISIVDDDQPYRESMRKLVTLLGFRVEEFASAADFLGSRLLDETACLVADVHMPGMTGVELHGHLIKLGYAIPTILVTAYPDEGVRHQALRDGVFCYLGKPVDDEELERCIRLALNGGKPIDENS